MLILRLRLMLILRLQPLPPQIWLHRFSRRWLAVLLPLLHLVGQLRALLPGLSQSMAPLRAQRAGASAILLLHSSVHAVRRLLPLLRRWLLRRTLLRLLLLRPEGIGPFCSLRSTVLPVRRRSGAAISELRLGRRLRRRLRCRRKPLPGICCGVERTVLPRLRLVIRLLIGGSRYILGLLCGRCSRSRIAVCRQVPPDLLHQISGGALLIEHDPVGQLLCNSQPHPLHSSSFKT